MGGGLPSRRKIEAQASMMKGSGVELRRKDTGGRSRRKERRKARKLLLRQQIAIVAGAALVLALAGFAIYRQLAVPAESTPGATVQLTETGHFKCEFCDFEWDGTVTLSHPLDPYVKCPNCREKKAREATKCPQCGTWTLEPIPIPPRAFAELNKGEYRRWELEQLSMMAKATCPKCGALLHPQQPRSGAAPAP